MPLNGLHLDRYRLLHMLGTGGMGEVYLAEDTRITRQVAIKVIRGSGEILAQRALEDANRLFLREAKAIAALQHPCILPLFDYGDVTINEDTLSYMVMPYCQDGTLAHWFQNEEGARVLSLQQVTHILEQAADALQYAHDRQIVHQDVKLSNFLIHRWRTPGLPELFLADFGIATFLSARSHTSHAIRGTPTAMAPEQWEGHPVAATDQYALAVMIYQLLTGMLPFQGGPGQIMYQHLMVSPPSPSTLCPEIPTSIDAVVLKALMKKPHERFATVLEFAHAFRQACINVPKPHEREENGLFNITLAIKSEEASLGTKKTLTLATGRSVPLVIPAGIQNGQTLCAGVSSEDGDTPLPVQTIMVTILILPPEQKADQHVTTTQNSSTMMQTTKPTPPIPPIPATIASVFIPTPETLVGPVPMFSHEEQIRRSEHVKSQHQRGIRSKVLLILMLVVVLIVSSTGFIMYIVQSHPPMRGVGQTQATALPPHASATTLQPTHQGTITTHPPSPTPLVQTSSPNPYPPFLGTLVLDDPLDSNGKGYSWEEGTRDLGTCTFTSGAYDANIALAGYFHSCLALSTQMHDFAFEVQMQLVSGTAGGLVFRADRATTHLYYFTIDRNGTYLLKVYYDKQGDATVKASGAGVAFNGMGMVGVVAQGNSMSLYINRQLVQQVNDGSFLRGQIGMVVYQGEALFRNARAWVL